MKIHVTQDDIYRGNRRNCNYCPVARAVARATSESEVYVGGDIFIRKNEHGSVYHAPRSVRRFIRRFDKGLPVAPFTFILRPKERI